MVGCAQHILELCVEHAKARKQFGRPLGSFQAVQHFCADLLRNVEGARYLLYRAAWKMQEGCESAADVAMAKAHAGQACLAVARRAHQLLGAISFCEEHPLHLFHKRILAASLDFGDPAHHLETVATAIGLQ
jgi:alkylation response protein AidB-like acyl-CoA dehydrogenase